MLNLLLVAPTCDGEDVGEAWVAFQWAKRLSARHRLTLLTYHKQGRIPAAAQLPGVEVIEWVEPKLFSGMERLNSMLKPGYARFFLRARRWVRAALAQGRTFDIAHQAVPVAMRYPTPLLGLGLPYLIGPVGGSLDAPSGFSASGDTAPWYVGLRKLDRLRLRFDPMLRRTYEDADCVVGIAPYVGEFLAGLSVRRLEFLSETGVEALPEAVDRSQRGGPLRLLFVGRVIRTKGVREAIGALRHLRDAPVVLDIVGDGFDRRKCEEIAAAIGVADKVVFHGRKSRREVDEFYRQADVFVFPSYREPGGNAPFEAMAWGLPLIAANRGGPAAAVDATSGVLIEPETPEQMEREIAAAVTRLLADRESRLALGAGARRRVARIGLWDQKIRNMEALYEDVLRAPRAVAAGHGRREGGLVGRMWQ
jgi:glycosyltransferase involved in cell wall biosynthesis